MFFLTFILMQSSMCVFWWRTSPKHLSFISMLSMAFCAHWGSSFIFGTAFSSRYSCISQTDVQLRDRSYILRTPYSYLYSMMSALFHGLPNAPRTSAGTSSLSDCANAPGIVSHCQPQVYSLSRIWPLPPALSLHIQKSSQAGLHPAPSKVCGWI